MKTLPQGVHSVLRFVPLFAVITAMVIATGSASAQERRVLFRYALQADLSDAQREQLDVYKADPTAAEAWIIELRPEAIREADQTTIDLLDGDDIQLSGMRIDRRSTDDDYSLFGITDEPDTQVTLVVRGQDVVGTIRKGDRLYAVRPLSGGLSALILRDVDAMPEDHPPEFEQEMERRMRERRDLPDLEQLDKSSLIDTGGTIDILVAWTPAAANQAGHIGALIQLAVDETNQSYANSGITPRLRLVHSYQTNYTEADNNMRLDRDRFRIPDDSFMDEVHTRRNRYRADIAVLFMGNSNYCGYASDIFANPETAFAVVAQNCATGYYSFGHEIGHLQGARHDPAADSSTEPFPYGHGFCYTSANWRTVMSYNNGCRNRLQYWSNPSVRRGSVAMGTSATHHNTRVLNGTAAFVANFRTASATPCRAGFQPAGARLCISVNAHSARTYANAMTYCKDRGSRVASYGDLRYLYVRTAVDAAYNPRGRWIGNFVDDDRALCGNRDITRDNDPDIGNFEGTCNRFDSRSFWCAYDR